MNPTKELKALNQIDAICTNTNVELKKVRYFVWGCRIFGWMAVFLAVLLIQQHQVTPLVGLVIAAFGGVAIGLAIYGQMALSQWPVLKYYIDVNGVKSRINELKTQ